MNKNLLLFFLFISLSCFSQFSKTHYIPPLTAQNNFAEDQYIYISTPSITNVNFKIIENGGSSITGVVNKNTPYRHAIGRGENTQLFTPKTTIGKINNKGYIIEAEDLIYVSVRVNAARNNGNYNHAGGLVSKGNSALGTVFRLGAMLNPLFDPTLLNFASILSTENGTKVTLSNIPIGTIFSNGTTFTGPITVTLDKNESYVLALENIDNNTPSNSSQMIGALVESDKPVVVNSGSFAGSNSTLIGNLPDGTTGPTGRDVGFDQIVPLEKTGKEYIFVKGVGTDELERVLLVANFDNTQVFINGTTLFKTINKGEYAAIDGSLFTNGNLFVTTSQNVFAYQSIGGSGAAANQNMFFVPPLNCATPNTVDNIPQIELIGSTIFNGGLNIVTETGATVTVNNMPVTGSLLPVTGPLGITGNTNFVRYTINGLSGNITVKSTKQVYVSYFGTNGAATYGGYYSGFDTKPEIVTNKISLTSSSCIPNVVLKINTLSSYDTFQWFKDGSQIFGATTSTFTPTQPGYYQVRGSISGCSSTAFSDKIPISDCSLDTDNDGVNNNIDIDLDNDGITNTYESNIFLLNQTSTTNSPDYTATISGTGTITGKPIYGFVSEVPAGKTNSVTYSINLTKPQSLSLSYIAQDHPSQTTAISEYLNADGDFILRVPANKTITVTDPQNQLLIDTNYDGVYESGVTEFSSFEIRFRLKSTLPLTPGLGTFKFSTYLTNSITLVHNNLSETSINKAIFMINRTETIDSDLDGVPDLLDLDSDNDGVLDNIEAQGKGFKVFSGIDTNKDGLDNNFEPGLNRINTDNDVFGTAIYKYDVLDLDSDNDGIFDLVESGSNAPDVNKDGIIDGSPSSFGANGLFDNLETTPESGILKYTITDTDSDGSFNYIDLDSDGDSCNDTIEAGFTDNNNDGILGNNPVTINSNGIVTSRIDGYTTPHSNYTTAALIMITKQPSNQSECEFKNATVTIETNPVDGYQWQVSTNGVNWIDLINNVTYAGVTTKTLTITRVINTMNGYKYRVKLNKTGNSCGLTSDETTLTVYALPVVSDTTIIQCDDDLDAISSFNLTVKNNVISSNSANETFTYYPSLAGANTANPSELISNPLAFVNTTPGSMSVWTRVANINGCFSVAKLTLRVLATQIPSTFKRTLRRCDDYLDAAHDDKDGISNFDFNSITNDILNLLPSGNYSITYYKNQTDALSELNVITNTSNYRNSDHPNAQQIWVRIDSDIDNSCYGLGPFVDLKVDSLPNINLNTNGSEDEYVCTNLPNLFVQLDAGIQDGSPTSNYTYIWTKDGIVLPKTSPTLNINTAGTYTVEVFTLSGCSRIRTLKVKSSEEAHIENIVVVDLADVNTATINASGTGDYVYNLDDINGLYQESNFFDNVSAGIHTAYIKDNHQCGIAAKTFAVVSVPKYFTPNNDGFNDYWNIKGVNANFNSNSKIYIFDRYGKLIKQLIPSSQGWDGTYNGLPLVSDDYWYTVKLDDGREIKGHFSLKR